jgi:hypothetical protein
VLVSRGWFSIERIGFLALSGLVTFVAHVMIVGHAQAFLRLIVLGARTLKDNLRLLGRLHALDGGESAEELIGDIGENGGAASGDAVLSLEDIEVFGILNEFGSEVGGLHIFGKSGVTSTEARIGVGDEFAAASAIGEAMLAAAGIIDWKRVRWLLGLDRRLVAEFWLVNCSLRVHFFLDWGESKKHPP